MDQPNKLPVTKGDVEFIRMREILPTKEDFFLWEFNSHPIFDDGEVLLSGDDNIILKFWHEKEGKGKPTLVDTGLKWKTFDMDDNILVMVKQSQFSTTILFTKKYH